MVFFFFFNDTATTEIYTPFPTRRSSDLRDFNGGYANRFPRHGRHKRLTDGKGRAALRGPKAQADDGLYHPASGQAGKLREVVSALHRGGARGSAESGSGWASGAGRH